MNNYLLFILAAIPLLWIIISLGTSLMEAHKTTLSALALTVILALTIWHMPAANVFTAALEGFALGLWPIMAIVISAIFMYRLALHTKSMDLIKSMLSDISTDKRIQVLIIVWGFGSFLDAVSGFGVPVLIPASILIVLGFEPVLAVVICLISNSVPTAFGGVGVPINTLAGVAGLDVKYIGIYAAVQLAALFLVVPFVLVMVTGGSIRAVKGVVGITAVSGIAFVIPQLFSAIYLSVELPTLLGSIFSLCATIFWANCFHSDKKALKTTAVPFKKVFLAWLPYILITVLMVSTGSVFPAVEEFLGRIRTTLVIYSGNGAVPTVIKWVNSPVTIIVISAVIGGLCQGAGIKDIVRVFIETLKQNAKSTLTVLSIVAVSKVMAYSGMISAITTVLVAATGSYFPFLSPAIGTLGVFVTGSVTSSNVLFGALQKGVATSINSNPFWLVAANITGATAGKMISPQSIAIATTATGISGSEGIILNRTMKFCMGYIIVLAVIVYLGSLFV